MLLRLHGVYDAAAEAAGWDRAALERRSLPAGLPAPR